VGGCGWLAEKGERGEGNWVLGAGYWERKKKESTSSKASIHTY